MMRSVANVAWRDTLFAAAGRFPSADFLTLPLSEDAERYYNYGVPFLQPYLPFRAENLVD